MPQIQLPIFPAGATEINANLAFENRDGLITYFNGSMPVFVHDADDLNTFRMITSQFYINGNATQAELCRAFGIPPVSLKRAVKKYREHGAAGFYRARKTRGATILTTEVLAKAQQQLDAGDEPCEIAQALGIKSNTLNKAILDNRLHKSKKKENCRQQLVVSNKSERNAIDYQAAIGMGATNTMDRVAAMMGQISEVPIQFQSSLDVPNGGVLFALPALLSVGLLHNTKKYFQLSSGYYGLDSIFLLLAFMALARIKSVERLRYCVPGEWGNILGLDRIPEVKTLRSKIKTLSENGDTEQWSADLCAEWMEADLQESALLYVDGHVRVYHGSQTKLPRHHVARQRLCLRATVDYWVNAMDGQPFFFINKAVDPGLIKVVEDEIIPRLESDVPNKPTKEQLENNPLLTHFTLVFDREGYSPDLLLRLKKKQVACMTYHKFPGENWQSEEFLTQQVRLVSGEVVSMQLAERGTWLSKKLWVREIRKLTESGHQTSVISTNFQMDFIQIAASMFARWTQENFFRYMRQHYNIDSLYDYCLEDIPDLTSVVNPKYREIDSKIRSLTTKHSRHLAQFGAINLESDIAPEKVEAYEKKKAEIFEKISELKESIDQLKSVRSQIEKHIDISKLPKDDRFSKLRTHTKHLIDTVKMVAYRAETAMASVLRENMARLDDARQVVLGLYQSEVDILTDNKENTLTVRLHRLANRCNDKAIQNLCVELNETETVFPGTQLRMIFEFGTN